MAGKKTKKKKQKTANISGVARRILRMLCRIGVFGLGSRTRGPFEATFGAQSRGRWIRIEARSTWTLRWYGFGSPGCCF